MKTLMQIGIVCVVLGMFASSVYGLDDAACAKLEKAGITDPKTVVKLGQTLDDKQIAALKALDDTKLQPLAALPTDDAKIAALLTLLPPPSAPRGAPSPAPKTARAKGILRALNELLGRSVDAQAAKLEQAVQTAPAGTGSSKWLAHVGLAILMGLGALMLFHNPSRVRVPLMVGVGIGVLVILVLFVDFFEGEFAWAPTIALLGGAGWILHRFWGERGEEG